MFEAFTDPDGYTMYVVTIRQIDRNLTAPDWVEFMWTAAHPGDTLSDIGEPGQTPSGDWGCKAEKYFDAYNQAASRFSSTAGKTPPGYWITFCGEDTYPVEETEVVDNDREYDFSVRTAGEDPSFWNRYLLDDRKQSYKMKNPLASAQHTNWCVDRCPPSLAISGQCPESLK